MRETIQAKYTSEKNTSKQLLLKAFNAHCDTSKKSNAELRKQNVKPLSCNHIKTPRRIKTVSFVDGNEKPVKKSKLEQSEDFAEDQFQKPCQNATPFTLLVANKLNKNSSECIVKPQFPIKKQSSSTGKNDKSVLRVAHVSPLTTLQGTSNGSVANPSKLDTSRQMQLKTSFGRDAHLIKSGLVQQTLTGPSLRRTTPSAVYNKTNHQGEVKVNEIQGASIQINFESDGEPDFNKLSNLSDTATDLPSLIIRNVGTVGPILRHKEASIGNHKKQISKPVSRVDLNEATTKETSCYDADETSIITSRKPSASCTETSVKHSTTVTSNIITTNSHSEINKGRRTPASYTRYKTAKTTPLSRPLASLNGGKVTSPLCNCGRRARSRIVINPGPNQGRSFFTCSLNHNRPIASFTNHSVSKKVRTGCGYFQWESQVTCTHSSVKKVSNHSFTPSIKPPVFITPPVEKKLVLQEKLNNFVSL